MSEARDGNFHPRTLTIHFVEYYLQKLSDHNIPRQHEAYMNK